MIYDKIDNWKIYASISDDISLGFEFLSKLKPDVENGIHVLSPNVKAIVSEYDTKTVNEYGYEAHREFIDIQYLVCGEEIIFSLPLECLKEYKPYDASIDAAFYKERGVNGQKLMIGKGYFAVFFPQDGHMPCLCINEAKKVKKIVVKVKIS